jgi:amidohydrolase
MIFHFSYNLGVQAALKAAPTSDLGRVIVYGTPAEEGGGGKVKMINNDCFNEVDFIMMVHPNPYDAAFPTYIACATVTVIFKGHSAHASGGPWEGVNALDAAVMAYNGISTMRQQMKPSWRAHGIIAEGGTAFNVIPARTRLVCGVRAPTVPELKILKKKIHSVFEAAALATGG